MKTARISDFLTGDEISQAIKLYKESAPGTFATNCAERIISPNLTRINSSLGQENDPKYLAYAVEAAIMHSARNS